MQVHFRFRATISLNNENNTQPVSSYNFGHRSAMTYAYGFHVSRKMKKSVSVNISLLIILVWIIGTIAGWIPNEINFTAEESPILKAFGIIALVASIRLFVILFFQTLIHAAHHASSENKTAIIIGHFFLGPLVSIPYFYLSRLPKVENQ